jgi:pimeloyl-ACP methyl ester carboxylesterase
VAWNSALLRPDLFRAVVGMSVVFASPSRTDLLSALRQQGVNDFYMQYFQAPGVAEAELERDVKATIRLIHFNGSGDAPDRVAFGRVPAGTGCLDHLTQPSHLPAWLTEAEIAEYAAEFSRTGFRGGLNWYRNFARSAELLAPWRGMTLHQPSMFIAGSRDDVLKFPGTQARIDNLAQTLPGLRGCHLLEGAGHWIQRERAAAVNELLVGFLKSL